MDSKTAFVRFVSTEYSINVWSDLAIQRAIELANELSPSEWAELRLTWQDLVPTVQTRLAEVASEVSSENLNICEMLVAMLSSTSPVVVEASLDSLNFIGKLSPERLHGLKLEQALTNIVPGDNIVASLVESLQRTLKQGA